MHCHQDEAVQHRAQRPTHRSPRIRIGRLTPRATAPAAAAFAAVALACASTGSSPAQADRAAAQGAITASPGAARCTKTMVPLRVEHHTRVIALVRDNRARVLKATGRTRSADRMLRAVLALPGIDADLRAALCTVRTLSPGVQAAGQRLSAAATKRIASATATLGRARSVPAMIVTAEKLRDAARPATALRIGLGLCADLLRDGQTTIYSPEPKPAPGLRKLNWREIGKNDCTGGLIGVGAGVAGGLAGMLLGGLVGSVTGSGVAVIEQSFAS